MTGKIMMKYNKSVAKLVWNQEVKARKEIIKTLLALKKFAKDYDGKVMNKRIIDAWSQSVSSSFTLGISPWNNIFHFGLVGPYDLYRVPLSWCSISISAPCKYFVCVCGKYDSDDYIYIDACRRLHYEALVKNINELIVKLTKEINVYLDSVKNFEKMFRKVEKINDGIRKLKEEFVGTPFELESDHIEFLRLNYEYWKY